MMSHEENVGVFIDAWKLMVGRLPGATIEQAGGIATMFGHVPMPFFNMSALDRPLTDVSGLRGALALAGERAKTCRDSSMLAICEPWVPENWERIAAEEGFAPLMNITGMAADRLLPPRRPSPELEFRRVSDEATARDLAMINAQAYGMPMELFECMCNLYLWHDDSFGYVGYSGDRAVSSAAAFPVAGTVYIALVATLPEAYGKGYGEAVMRLAIAQGQRAMGLTRLTLHATDMGQPLYRSMGFESGAGMAVLAPADGSAAH